MEDIYMAKKSGASREDIEWGADEVILYLDNEPQTYNQKLYMFKNLSRKVDRGVFDPVKAEKTFKPLTDRIRIDYNKQGYGAENFIHIEASRFAAKLLVQEFLSAKKHKEYDFM